MVKSLAKQMIESAKESLELLRSEIRDVSEGPIVDGKITVYFEFRGKWLQLPLESADHFIFGDGRESDKSIALRALLASYAKTEIFCIEDRKPRQRSTKHKRQD